MKLEKSIKSKSSISGLNDASTRGSGGVNVLGAESTLSWSQHAGPTKGGGLLFASAKNGDDGGQLENRFAAMLLTTI